MKRLTGKGKGAKNKTKGKGKRDEDEEDEEEDFDDIVKMTEDALQRVKRLCTLEELNGADISVEGQDYYVSTAHGYTL